VALTEAGHKRVVDLCHALGGVWAGAMRREELVTQALTALHLFERDDHYLVREGKIQVIDEHTGPRHGGPLVGQACTSLSKQRRV